MAAFAAMTSVLGRQGRTFTLRRHSKATSRRQDHDGKDAQFRARRLAAMRDEDIDVPVIREQADWSGAAVGKFYRPVKRQVTLRIDAGVLAWFKAQGGKYQTAVNAALSEHQARQRRRAPAPELHDFCIGPDADSCGAACNAPHKMRAYTLPEVGGSSRTMVPEPKLMSPAEGKAVDRGTLR